ncbi:MAG: prefoldin subunit alpha [Candidatus Heimdallarchaeota archaeon]|nr:MAG: prefoldin subunit alpha [Candidatus Heimdallarchaeota archaeon]
MSESTIPEDILNRVKILQEEIDQLQLNISTIEQQIAILLNATHSINDAIRTHNELKTKKPGDEILVPVGGSNYILCTLKDPQQTFISLGSGVTLLTGLKDSEERNKNQIENLERNIKQLQEQNLQFSQMLNSRKQELVKIAQKHQLLR